VCNSQPYGARRFAIIRSIHIPVLRKYNVVVRYCCSSSASDLKSDVESNRRMTFAHLAGVVCRHSFFKSIIEISQFLYLSERVLSH
jgi:hypothetical protein